MKQVCPVCFAHCTLAEGISGRCRARENKGGVIVPSTYGRFTSVALDPIEKKPLRRFFPGSRILSVGSYGCNLRCPFCQNHEISMKGPKDGIRTEYIGPEELVNLASGLRSKGNIGIAFTYNEPMINYEYIIDSGRLAKESDLKIVLVTNGTAEKDILTQVLPYVDAMNIDIKGFTEDYYRDFLGGDLHQVMTFIETAVQSCHIELTMLVIPEKNDSEQNMRDLCSWITSLPGGREIPLHISRFFPAYKMKNTFPTPVETVYFLKEVAQEYLKYVYTGNC